ncbi:MAG: TolC family protein [Deltaproteobacteria bacterium]|nr:TolC family protein [Deltaproteobacteria bacterium]
MKGCLGVVCFFLFPVFILPCQGQARELTFTEILEQAVANSHDLTMSTLDVEISEQRLAEAGAMYWPTLSLRFTNEYLYDLSKEATGTVSVGETIIPGNDSTWQHSVALAAQYLLYDFGARPRKYQNVERGVMLAGHTKAQRLIDLKIEVLSLYGNGLRLHKQMEIWSSLLNLRQEVYQLTQRLVAAGNKGRLEQGNAAISVAEALQTRETLRLEMADVLEKLTYYTGTSYQAGEVRFADFPAETGQEISADVLNLPGIKAYDVAIAQKKTEYEIALRQWLPTFTLYSAYHLYGDDPTNFTGSIENLAEKNTTIGVMLNMNLFNGFSDRAKVARLDTELRRLQAEKAKKVAEDEQKLRSLAQKNLLAQV